MNRFMVAIVHDPTTDIENAKMVIDQLKEVFPESPPFVFSYGDGFSEQIPNGVHYLKLAGNHDKEKGLSFCWQNIRMSAFALGKPWILIISSNIQATIEDWKQLKDKCKTALIPENKTMAYLAMEDHGGDRYRLDIAIMSGKALTYFAPLTYLHEEGGKQVFNAIKHHKAEEFIGGL